MTEKTTIENRFVVIWNDEIEVINMKDFMKYKEKYPCRYASFYDLQNGRWVDIGKRGPIKAKRQYDYFCNVLADIKNSVGMLTLEELEESYKRSEDTLTDFDIATWEKKRKAAMNLGLVE